MKFKKTISSVFTAIVLSACIFARGTIGQDPIVDNANLLSSSQYEALDREIRSVYENGGPQIGVMTINSLNGKSLEEYSMKVADQWKLGSSKEDNGVLLLIAYNERKIRIEVGYGLEGDLTDTKCGMIIRNIMAPKFQSGRYGDGIIDAVRAIESVTGVVTDDADYDFDEQVEPTGNPAIMAFGVFLMFLFIIITGALSKHIPFFRWLPWILLFRSSGDHHHHHHHDDHFGGGFGGGGFSGGGGGFGGGGASGGW